MHKALRTNYHSTQHPVLCTLITALCTLFLFSCGNKKQAEMENHPHVAFHFNDTDYFLKGIADIHSEFYQHHWPKDFTKEKIKQSNLENQDVICGRLTSISKDTMFEMFVHWPEKHKVSKLDILKLKNDTIWTLSPAKKNYDSATTQIIGKYARMYFFNTINEFLPDNEPEGFIYFEQIVPKDGNFYSGRGTFEFTVHDAEQKVNRMTKGKFYLDFYVGL